jgi:hypothetical protein
MLKEEGKTRHTANTRSIEELVDGRRWVGGRQTSDESSVSEVSDMSECGRGSTYLIRVMPVHCRHVSIA